MKTIVIRNSRIHGQGVFAGRDISIGETIIDWSGCTDLLTKLEVDTLPDRERKYVSFIDGQYVLFLPPARFVNHSCDPNARGGNGHDLALRNIREGEEITVDYVIEHVPGLNLTCNCGAARCRGLLRSNPAET